MWVGFSVSEIESRGNLKRATLGEKHLKKKSTTPKHEVKEIRPERDRLQRGSAEFQQEIDTPRNANTSQEFAQ
jgi:hypothetical protein